ncbi:MAG: TIGR01777 family oxidoreductase [Actinomycetota bacterium]|nr:TIGR01777 family oxidoreductase [Actinomycetota bacterium]
MRVVVTGATGTIGRALTSALVKRGDEAVALTRDPDRARRRLGAEVELHAWAEPKQAPPPYAVLAGADAVVHLLGEPIAQRWTAAAKNEIRDSRVLTTRSLVAGLAGLAPERRPAVLVCQSATGYYGPRGSEPVGEDGAPGQDFLAGVTAAWEYEALAAGELPGVRVVLTRTGVVLSPSGGALAKMLPPFRLGVGGPVAGGRQYVPWVHLEDVAGALLHCIEDRRAAGPVNVTSADPVTNAELSRTLGHVLHRPAVLPVPAAAVRLLYGQMASIVLTGQRVVPRRLLELGYSFRHPELERALRDVLAAG